MRLPVFKWQSLEVCGVNRISIIDVILTFFQRATKEGSSDYVNEYTLLSQGYCVERSARMEDF